MSSTETDVAGYVAGSEQGADLTMADLPVNDGKERPESPGFKDLYPYDPTPSEMETNRVAIGHELTKFDPSDVTPMKLTFRVIRPKSTQGKKNRKFQHVTPVFVKKLFSIMKIIEPNVAFRSIPKEDLDENMTVFIQHQDDIKIDNKTNAKSFLDSYVEDLGHDPTTNCLSGNIYLHSTQTLGWMKRRGAQPSILLSWMRTNGVSLDYHHNMTTSARSLVGYLFFGHPGTDRDPVVSRRLERILASEIPEDKLRFSVVTGHLYFRKYTCRVFKVYTEPHLKKGMIAALNKVKALLLPENKIPVPGNLVFVSAPVWDSMHHVRSKDPYLQGKRRSRLQASGNSTVVLTETNSTTNSLDNPRLFFISHQNNIVEEFRSIITKTFCLAPSVVCSKNEESPQLPI